jgi:hypothetical protein
MRKISLVAFAVLAAASASAHAAPSRGLILASADATPAVQSTAPAAQPVPATQAAPATTILQTTNPQAQMVLKQLQAHGLIKAQPATQPAQQSSATVVTLPASGQPALAQTVQTQPVQAQTVQTPVAQTQTVATPPAATAPQAPVTQLTTAPVTPTARVAKPVVHASSHHETDEQKARRIAARYGIHW